MIYFSYTSIDPSKGSTRLFNFHELMDDVIWDVTPAINLWLDKLERQPHSFEPADIILKLDPYGIRKAKRSMKSNFYSFKCQSSFQPQQILSNLSSYSLNLSRISLILN